MSDAAHDNSPLSPLKRALLALKDMRSRLDEMEGAKKEPIAVIGLGCRFPGGARDPESYWRLLRDGVDAISEVPTARWNADEFYDPDPDTPGKMNTRWGGFLLDGVDSFDARFFGITPREAKSMDPQQRLLLEVSWEALENAGQAPASLNGSATGVFVGICTNDYAKFFDDPLRIDSYMSTGNTFSVAAGRLSYTFGLQGPCMAVDTACSSSLVAVHLATQSLRNGECRMALAGGVNLILSPFSTLALSRLRMMAPDGRCKTFDASADGFVRGEGCGVVVLKRLRDAVTDGDKILAVIRGTAVNQDGRSGGLTAPNGPAQEAVIRQALRSGGVEPAQVSYVEAHGTGTSLGDPIEIKALGAVLGEGRAEDLILGSVKTNIGHLEAAAGIAAFIKVVLALSHQEIPPHLHLQSLNPHISLKEIPAVVAMERIPWLAGSRARIAGVSSFGFSGTNAHAVLEEAPAHKKEATVAQPSTHVLCLSARSETALKNLARHYVAHLTAHPTEDLGAICHTAGAGRSHFDHRLAVVASTADEAIKELKAYIGGVSGAWISGRAPEGEIAKVAFVFSEPDAEFDALSCVLFGNQRKFQETLARGHEVAPSASKDLPLFALQRSLSEVWQSCGVAPSAVLGEGVGEYAAACCAGVINLEDAWRLVSARAGREAPDTPRANGARLTQSEFDRVVDEVDFHTPLLPIISSLTGRRAESRQIAGKEYWRRQSSHESQIREGVAALWEEGFRIFVEIGPASTLDVRTSEWVAGKGGFWIPILKVGRNGWEHAPESLARLYIEGVAIDWTGVYAKRPTKVALPTYPFERRRFWVDDAPEHASPAPAIASPPKPARDWLYDLEWQRQSSHERCAQHLPSPPEIARVLASTAARLGADFGLGLYQDLLPQTDVLSVAYVAQALQKLGWQIQPGERVSAESLAGQLRVVPRHRPLLGRMLEMLADVGVLRKEPSGWLVSRIPDPIDAEELYDALLSRYPACEGELSLFSSCGRKLAEILHGESDALQILFPGGSVAPVEKLYQYSPFFQAMNTLVGEAFSIALAALPPGGKVRILEIGAGTGGTTSFVLSRLPADRVEYFFTDVSTLFTIHAASKFAAYPFVRYGLLDIERDLGAQGFADGSFDLVIAANVLHATSDLRHTLRQVRRLLAPDGLLLLLEGTRPQLWADLVFGLTEGWWKFADADLRPSHPLVSKQRWLELLSETGFSNPTPAPGEDEATGRSSQQLLFMARATGVAAPRQPSPEPGTWLVFADKGGLGEELSRRIKDQGDDCVIVTQGEVSRMTADGQGTLNAADRIGFERLIEHVSAKHPRACRGVVHLWSLDSPGPELMTPASLESAAMANCGSALHLVQTLLRADGSTAPHVWLVTRGAQQVAQQSQPPSPAQAPLWGLGRVIALEHPEVWGGLIDLDPETSADEAGVILDLIQSSTGEDQLAIRRGENYVARLIPANPTPLANPVFEPAATYLITGGLGGLGLKIARWMVDHGARHLALLGLTGLPDRARWVDLPHGSESWKRAAAVDELEQFGARIQVIESDVSDVERVVPIVQALVAADPPLKGIIHAAGIFPPQTVQSLDLESLRSVFRPKLAGGWILHQAAKTAQLDFFVSFSSAAAIWGTRGGAHYAAANHFLDALSHYRHSLGLPALSINWARWEGGMSSGEAERFFDLIGLAAMQSSQALEVMGDLMHAGAVQKTVAAVDWNIFKPIYEAKRRRPLLEQIQAARPSAVGRPSASPSMARQFEEASPANRWDMLLAHTKAEVSKVLGFGPGEEPALDEGFFKIGMDSLTSVELKTRLESSLGRSLPATLAFEHSTVETLARHLYSELFGAKPEVSPAVEDLEANKTAALLAGLEQLSEDAARSELLEELANLKRDLQ